jgi:hypothetical protein
MIMFQYVMVVKLYLHIDDGVNQTVIYSRYALSHDKPAEKNCAVRTNN